MLRRKKASIPVRGYFMCNYLHLRILSATLLTVALAMSPTPAHAAGVVVGATNDSNCLPFSCYRSTVTEYQQVYSSAAFSAPISIYSLTFYNTFTNFGFLLSPGTFKLYLSTTSAPVGGLSTTFATNIGADESLVYSGTLPMDSQLSLGGHFDFLLSKKFSYNPATGNLLLTVISPNDAVTDSFLDSQDSSALMSRAYGSGLSGSTDGIGLVTGFNVAPKTGPPKVTVLKTFSAVDSDGMNLDGEGPDSRPVLGSDRLLYGMTNGGNNPNNGGGRYGNGVIYSFNPVTREYKALHAFSALDSHGHNDDGAIGAYGLIRGPHGAFYGQTQAGGTHGNGTVFKITSSGHFSVLHTYSAVDTHGKNEDGASPVRSLVAGADGNLYGTTRLGGPNAVGGAGLGVAWMMDPGGGGFTVIHAFTAEDGHAASLVQARDGYFYGCAVWPNATLGSGTLFRLVAGYYEALYRFSSVDKNGANADGAECYEPLLERSDGVFYGSTTYGGPNGTGAVFRFTLTGGKSEIEILHSFEALETNGTNADGANPQARLVVGPDDALYSTASYGGSGGSGLIYRLSDHGYAVLYAFSALDAHRNNADGAYPDFGALATRDNDGDSDAVVLYGTAANGGAHGDGTLYRLRIDD
jgi:uncharacterized repeat protein (TIGR03803 family)